ncbi:MULTISPECIES: GNAT family N-acetyltransferase [Ruminococcus]|uniref:GCN5-related N-acetyltransferase n=1 Tax=Ruminococcus albus (strain ATCC 27210 / DSM 20455 / JCM 14654 / NCDO 2250 / 7) TaxID=697329 RepID=E6UL37_RUMA7|nr:MULTISPECIES: GNAT family N-acetyltransferase [Ruminococcus]ADU24383.1 GCN5-related N-acetyltransferase [Ruminococcus albus 7 = DSM 20455]MCR5021201.1 GNAT family N-acetyltransferase [Ruminococcus sp.]
MNIRLINIKHDTTDIDKIMRLYNTAFPSDERAPFGILVKGAAKPNVNFFSCLDGDTWIGFIYTVNYRDLSYVFYFAVDDAVRGKGYGTAILKAAQKKYSGRKLFLAIEEVDKKYKNYSQRVNRLRFYERAGFVRTGQKMQEAKVIYDLMSTGGRIQNAEYRKLMRSFAGLRMLLFTVKILND